jgi:hypothetical protein
MHVAMFFAMPLALIVDQCPAWDSMGKVKGDLVPSQEWVDGLTAATEDPRCWVVLLPL